MADNLTFRLDVDSTQATQSINNFFQNFEQGAARAKGALNREFGQGLQTEVKIEFKNGELVARKVQSIRQESNRLGDIWNAVNGTIGKTPNELKKQASILKQLRGDTKKYEDGTKRVTAEWQALTKRIKDVDDAQRKMSGTNFMSGFAGRFALVQTAANLATSAIMGVVRGIQDLGATAMRMETLQLQLEAFAGGADNAQKAFDRFVEIAANSPLNLEQVANAGKIMMAYGMETEQAMKATEQLAMVSAATGGDINLLARNMGQIVAQGRAYTRDLTQFAIQGIPIWNMLAVATGESVSALKDLAQEGKIGAAEVSAALELMTAKGTGFASVAERMQETFQGRLARIEAAFQKLAAEAIGAFNELDKAFLGIVSGSMKLFADTIFLIAKNFKTVARVVASATAGLIAFTTISNFGAIIGFIGTAITGFVALAGKIWAAVTAQIALMASMGPSGWAQLAIGVGVAAAAFIGLQGTLNAATEEAAMADAEMAQLSNTLANVSEAEKELANNTGHSQMVKGFEKAREEADKLKQQLDAQIAVLKRQKEVLEEKYKIEEERIKENLDLIKQKIQEENEGYAKNRDALKDKYDEEKTALQENLELVRERYGEEIAALEAKTPAEKQLYDLEKKKLQEKIASGKLDEEELLRAKARLERMERTEQIAKLRTEQAEEEKRIQDEIKGIEEARNTELEELKDNHQQVLEELKNQQKTAQDALRENRRLRKEEVAEIEETIDVVGELNLNVEVGTNNVNQQVAAVKNLTSQWWEAEKAARATAAAIRDANAQRAAGSNSGARASGGPVAGGSTYTVNELGQEAFLSASGKLSMINAPAWGDWRAPGRGTVIPAHLTKQLDIPSGGVNLNSAASASAARAGASGDGLPGMVRALAASVGGDNINNNVTVQSVNPNKTASDMLVAMTKVRRRRLR